MTIIQFVAFPLTTTLVLTKRQQIKSFIQKTMQVCSKRVLMKMVCLRESDGFKLPKYAKYSR